MSTDLQHLLSQLEPRQYSPEERELISRAYQVAKEAHSGQTRKNGEPYFNHVFAAAQIAADWQMDATTIAATLLHDTVEDTELTLDQVRESFGQEIAFLVNGVTKLSQVKYRGNERQSETLRKMILALSEDIRVVFVKLADRMHNMQTLEHLPPDKQKRIALETSEIYAPLAYRMGLGTVSGDLEDLAFPYLHPAEYRYLKHYLKNHLTKGERYIAKVKAAAAQALEQHHVSYIQIDSRVKRISSLYKKLQRHTMDLDQIHDLIALRIITPRLEDCYAALGVLHSLWPPLPGHIKDYIALPKPNGYRSLHTTVIALHNKPTEFQIRTAEMHHENEYGIAAYWAYQEGKSGKKYKNNQAVFANAQQLSWINQLKDWQDKLDEPDEFISALKIDFFKDRIFVITPKGEAIDLPAGATPVDFAYAIHSDVGDHCIGAKVNGRIVQLDQPLQSGDSIEIMTQKNKRPNQAWLSFVKTRHARTRIRSVLREKEQANAYTVFTITGINRLALLKDISSLFSKQRISISGVEAPHSKNNAIVTIKVTANLDQQVKAEQLALKLRSIANIQEVEYRRQAN